MDIVYNKVNHKVILNGTHVQIDGVDYPYNFSAESTNHYIIKTDKQANAYIVKDKNKIYVAISGEHYEFTEIDADELFEEQGASNQKHEKIFAPMPGSVVKVLVSVGDKVEAKSQLIAVEAMKMETTLCSTIEGIVTKVNVSSGEQISTDTILIEIEKEDE